MYCENQIKTVHAFFSVEQSALDMHALFIFSRA